MTRLKLFAMRPAPRPRNQHEFVSAVRGWTDVFARPELGNFLFSPYSGEWYENVEIEGRRVAGFERWCLLGATSCPTTKKVNSMTWRTEEGIVWFFGPWQVHRGEGRAPLEGSVLIRDSAMGLVADWPWEPGKHPWGPLVARALSVERP